MITVNTILIWKGEDVKSGLITKLYNNLKLAGSMYYAALKLLINYQGSPGTYSSAGNPPFKQSNNLFNSIVSLSSRTIDTLVTEISTDVPYAETLELGGSLQLDPAQHTHASQPAQLFKEKLIAPRPAWLPTFNALVGTIISSLTR